MTAKIKTATRARNRRHHKPKGVSKHEFERVHWPYLPIVLLIGVLLSFGGQSGQLRAALHSPAGKVLDYATSMSIGGLLSSTNAARSTNGLAGLQLNDKLDAAAQAKANDMATRNYWSHYTPEGNPPWVFVTNQSYSYQKLGENLATGFSSEQATVDGWMASPPHRENLLDPAFTEIGFGFANNPDYTAAGGGPQTIAVAFYGRPTVLATSQTKPTPPAPPSPVAPPPAPIEASSANPPSPVTPPLAPQTSPPTKQPATTASLNHGLSLSVRTSRAQVAFAQLPIANFATGLTIFGLLACLGLIVGRHFLIIRRVWAYGEAWAFKHPLLDVGILIIGALLFLMSQTAGFIQ
jgi:hypothetical protein